MGAGPTRGYQDTADMYRYGANKGYYTDRPNYTTSTKRYDTNYDDYYYDDYNTGKYYDEYKYYDRSPRTTRRQVAAPTVSYSRHEATPSYYKQPSRRTTGGVPHYQMPTRTSSAKYGITQPTTTTRRGWVSDTDYVSI